MILSSDSFNCVAFAADCKYKWSVVDLFILFCSAIIIFFPGKNTTTLSTKQELSPEHQPKFVWLRGIVFFGDGIPQQYACELHHLVIMAQFQWGVFWIGIKRLSC